MWHRKGGLIVTAKEPATRIEDQDWSELVLEAFPTSYAGTTNRSVYSLRTASRTDVMMRSDGTGAVRFDISEADNGAERGWALRVHLSPKQRVTRAEVDGELVAAPLHLQPRSDSV